tara:strand:+ start:3484 stop:3912 length:429 start_codon:yes stop_codon:yes gene_type:complete
MHLNCSKCKKRLTKESLRPVKMENSFFKEYLCEEDKEEDFYNIRMKSGVFTTIKSSKKGWSSKDSGIKGLYQIIKEKAGIFVSEDSIDEAIIPEFKVGYGCCNWNMGQTFKCECNNILGEMYLDCFEDKSIKFYTQSVDRVY